MKINIKELVLDSGTQMRVNLDKATIADYAEVYLAGKKMPPIVAFSSNGSPRIVADGFHRVAGATAAKLSQIDVDLRKGDRAAAVRHALGANSVHGLRRTAADKALAVGRAFETFPDLSNQAVAELCGVCDDFVRKHRPADPAPVGNPPTDGGSPGEKPSKKPVSHPPSRIGKDGIRRKLPTPPAKKPEAKKKAPTDRTGETIPPEIQELWDRAEGIQGMLSGISTARGILVRAEETRDPVFAEVNFSSARSHLDQAYADIKLVKPHAVCPNCQGLAAKDCAACKGRGFVSEFWWTNCATADQKAARTKGAAK